MACVGGMPSCSLGLLTSSPENSLLLTVAYNAIVQSLTRGHCVDGGLLRCCSVQQLARCCSAAM
jgi:hypothetical protein